MAETEQAEGPQPGPIPPGLEETPKWSAAIIGKRLVWTIGVWKAAVPAGVKVAPIATAAIEKISSMTAPFGVTLHIDQPVFESMLPIAVFAFLLMGHDYAKLKTDSKWL